MSDPKQEAIAGLERAVADARWASLKDSEIQAVITTALLKKP